jgi:hypothetical protein
MAQHYNYPLSKDRYRFAHYWRNGKLWRFRVRRQPYGFTTTGLGITATWVLWPREDREVYRASAHH